jgi:hypothetical protein
MEKKKNMLTKVEDTLNSLDGLQKASPGPFFYTRVLANLQKEQMSPWEIIFSFLTKPAVAFASLSLIILLNAGALLYQKSDSSAIAITDQNEQVNIDDYNTTVATNSYYNENIEAR